MIELTPYDMVLYPTVIIQVEGINAPDIVQHMSSFRFNEHLRKLDECRIELIDVDRTLIEDPRLEPDTHWNVMWGYPHDMSSVRPMIVKIYEPKFDERGVVEIEVTLHAARPSLMKKFDKPNNWGSVSSSYVARRLAIRHGLRFQGNTSNDADAPIIQPPGMDDYEFLHMLADRIDYEFFVEKNLLTFRSSDAARSLGPRLEFVYGSAGGPSMLKSFQPIIKSYGKHGKIKGLAADTSKGKKDVNVDATAKTNPLSAQLGSDVTEKANPVTTDDSPGAMSVFGGISSLSASSGNVLVSRVDGTNVTMTGFQFNASDKSSLGGVQDGQAANKTISTPEINPQKVKKLVQAARRTELERAVRGKAEFIGSPRIRARCTYSIAGVDRRLAGLWYVAEATHKIDGKGYSVDVSDMRKGAYAAKSKTKPMVAPVTNSQHPCDPKSMSCPTVAPRNVTVNANTATVVSDSEGAVQNDVLIRSNVGVTATLSQYEQSSSVEAMPK